MTFQEQTLSKSEVSQKYKIPIEFLQKDDLTVKEIIQVNISNHFYTIIKFHEQKTIVRLGGKTLTDNGINTSNTLSVLTKIDFETFIDICFSENSKYQKINSLIKENDKVMLKKLRNLIEKDKNLFQK